MLNSFFKEIRPNLSRDMTEVDKSFKEFLTETDKNSVFEKTTPKHVFVLLSKLCKSKATGLDNISVKLLRECLDSLVESITHMFNQSLMTGIFPDVWKSARVTPLYKHSGMRSDPTSYRSISVIPVVAKVFERIIYDQLYHYLTKDDFLLYHQSGFIPCLRHLSKLLIAGSWI